MFAASKTASVSGAYQISRSLRFNKDDTTYLNRTPASAGNRTTWTWSAWVKRTNLSDFQYNLFGAATDGNNYDEFRFTTADKFRFFLVSGATIVLDLITTQLFRDPSAWYHLVVAYDSTQATASNRAKFYVNGVQVTTFDTATYPAQNTNSNFNSNVPAYIGYSTSNFRLNAYMTEVNFIDGQALTPSSFGQTDAQTGVWQPKAYSGSYGTNGFYLNFSDNSNTTAATLGKDYSGNGNNWTPNNFSVTAGAGNDSLVDSPTSYGTDTGVGGTVRGNYATWNPLQQLSSLPSNGNLFVETNGNVGDGAIRNTLGLSSGKWYFEATVSTNYPGNWNAGVIELTGASNAIATSNGNSTSKFAFILGGGTLTWYKKTNSSLTAISPSGCADGTVMSIAVDLDSGKMWVAKNGTWADSGDPSTGTNAQFTSIPSDTYLITAFPYKDGSGNISFNANFGQRPFAYTAPSGYKALCTQNLPIPTIGATTATQAALYFTPTTYTGNGSSSRAISNGINMSANGGLVWSKQRSGAEWHFLIDSVRGNTKYLSSNASNAEGTISTLVTSFDSTGYSIGNDSGINANGSTYVSWVWGAGGSGSTNTSGSITSTVSANTTSGFSVVTYTGNGSFGSVGHGLGAVPAMVIIKTRNNVYDWLVYHKSLGFLKTLFLNLTSGAVTATEINNTSSTTMTVQSEACTASNNYVAYCFAEIAGYSAFGQYTGNGSADGPFIYTGFRPSFVLIKRCDTTSGGYWNILDDTRNTSNVVDKELYANVSNAEATFTAVDFTSNGIKIRTSDSQYNGSAALYLYMAFAESPFKYSLAR